MEHISKIFIVKDGKHGLEYDYLLNQVFYHFVIKLGKGVSSTIKQDFT